MIEEGGPTRGIRVERSLYRRVVFRRLFYVQLAKIVSEKLFTKAAGRVFVSMMGSIGDLVYAFPSLAELAGRNVIEMGTGGYPYVAVVRSNPHIARVHAPFIYKPRRERDRRIIQRVLSRFYEKVVLLDIDDENWWKRGRHFAQVYAEACGCSIPRKGVIYLRTEHRRRAEQHLRERGLEDFIYVVQMVRHRLPFRSWPLDHYHSLYQLLHRRFAVPILVDTVGSDETQVPSFCVDAGRLDILTAAAVIEKARTFIGSDSGLTHVAAALGTPTVAIHLGYPPEVCAPLGENIALVRQRRPFDDPASTLPEEALHGAEAVMKDGSRRP